MGRRLAGLLEPVLQRSKVSDCCAEIIFAKLAWLEGSCVLVMVGNQSDIQFIF